MHQIKFYIENWLKAAIIVSIILYKKLISPFLGRSCRFHPSCSSYGLKALKRFTLLTSVFLILRRIIFCNPWALGGYKEVPSSFSAKRYFLMRLAAIKIKLLTFNVKR